LAGPYPHDSLRSSIKRVVRWLLWIAGVAAFMIVLGRSDVRGALPAIASAGPLLALGLVPYLLQIALDARAWRTLLGGLGHRVAWRRLIEIRLSTEAVLLSVPGGSLIGESLKPYLLNRITSLPFAPTIASIGAKRCLLALAEAGYLGIALAVAHDLYARSSTAVVGTESLAWYVGAAIALLALIGVGLGLALMSVSVADTARRMLAKLPSKRLRAALEARRAGFAATDAAFVALGQRRGRLVIAWLLLLSAWLVETGETYLLCRLVGVHLDASQALAMEAAVVFARNAAFFVPAGLGVQDAGYLAFLSAFGVAAPLATAFVVVKRTKELLWIAAGYLVLLLLDRRAPRESATTVSVAAPLGAGLGGL
jgi:uncharacterized membrane protein YbhN (UPF0104 family)